jgi:hypothetical protein
MTPNRDDVPRAPLPQSNVRDSHQQAHSLAFDLQPSQWCGAKKFSQHCS